MGQQLTLEDVAKLAGVHRSTVSRVINDSPNVSPEARKKVKKVIQSTGYQPNAAARSLASQRSNMIGLVLPRSVSSFFTDPFFPHLTQGIAFGCNNNNLSLSLFLAGNREDEDKILPRISRRGFLDGILIQAGRPDELLIDHLTKSNIPVVIIGRPFVSDGLSYIDIDNISAATRATQHLLDLGYQNIATIIGNHDSTVTIDRHEGFQKALAAAGRNIRPELVAEGDFSEHSGYLAMRTLLPYRPDALFCQSDIMAAGAMRAIQEAGLSVPEDIAIIGFDDIPIARQLKVQLTTVKQPITKFGIKAVELLIDLIENDPKPARRVILDTEIIVRDSCGAKIKREHA
jgi:LacI family transcriptional regulator